MTTRCLQVVLALGPLTSFACTSPESPEVAPGEITGAGGSYADAAVREGSSGAGGHDACPVWRAAAPDMFGPSPPPECIPPCMWEALVACGVPELVERSCIYQMRSAPGEPSFVCSADSSVVLEERSVDPYADGGGRPGWFRDIVIKYFVDGAVCLTAQGLHFTASGRAPVSRRWLDCSGNIVADDDFLGGYYGPLSVYCGGSDAGSGVYPYPPTWPPEVDLRTNPACAPWRPYQGGGTLNYGVRFVLDGWSMCQPGTCFPTPSVTPADAGPAEASDGAFSDPDAFDAQIDADSGS